MRVSTVALLSLLFVQSGGEERKTNMVVKILNKVLENIPGNFPVENVTLGLDEYGGFEGVTLNVEKMTNWTDGVGSYGFHIRVNLSEIAVDGRYNLKDLPVPELFPLSGKGDFHIHVEDVNLELKVKAVNNYDKGKLDFNITIFNFHVTDTKVNFENLMDDPDVADFLNQLIGNSIPKLVQSFKPKIVKILELYMDNYGNGIVNCIKTQLMDLENCIKNLFLTVVDDIVHRLF